MQLIKTITEMTIRFGTVTLSQKGDCFRLDLEISGIKELYVAKEEIKRLKAILAELEV